MNKNNWEYANDLADKHAKSGGIFIRLSDDGDSVAGVFCGEPYPREVIWTGEKYEPYDASNPAHRDKRPSLRVAINVFVPAEGMMKVFEGSTQWFKELRKCRERHGLDKSVFTIERHGDAGDPRTFYSIFPSDKIDAELRARLDDAELHELGALAAGGAQAAGGQSGGASSNAAIDDDTAGDLVRRLKALPRTDLDAFLARFKVQRVRELKVSQEEAALAFVSDAEARVSGAREIDPWG